MARKPGVVFLGYEDEPITEKYRGQVNYKVNKIGGEPDFPYNNIDNRILVCNLCGLQCRLVVQTYVPLENSLYSRVLYVFACINPKCWNHSESFKCIRIQKEELATLHVGFNTAASCNIVKKIDEWCPYNNDWGDGDDNNANPFEENSNILSDSNWKMSDDETSSTENSLKTGLGSLSIDDKNANSGALGGAVGRQNSPMATAEIEGNEEEAVTVETPTTPKTNLRALLNDSVASWSSPTNQALQIPNNTVFVPYFMSVWEEETEQHDTHVKELLMDYQKKNSDFPSADGNVNQINHMLEKEGIDMAVEEYEKARPLHGDLMFHRFMNKIYACPGHLLRYDREGSPLLLYKLQDMKRKCRYCQDELVFEFQLMSTIISMLRLQCDVKWHSRLDFGTVLIYTCKQSCWSSNDCFKEEVVILQKEIN